MTTSFEQHQRKKLQFSSDQNAFDFDTNLNISNGFKKAGHCSNNSASKNNNNENISAQLICNSKPNSGTPKRRLSYQNMNSPPISQPSKLPTPGILSHSVDDLSPSLTIKRPKCLIKEKPIKFTTFNYKNTLVNQTDSPYLISSGNLKNKNIGTESPKNLNDSFESLQSLSSDNSRLSNRYMTKRRFSKHKSAPLSNLTQQFINISSPISKMCHNHNHHPLNDISNLQQSQKISTNSLTNSIQNGFKLSEESISDEQRDDMTDLENLIYGNPSHVKENNNHMHIMQALENDSQFTNLIGDRSRAHILPTTQSNKHPDLCCISPETLVDVLNGIYDEQVKETIIIDSRYPYEFEGGHITTGVNYFTKERLYDEMVIKRSHKNTSLANKSHSSTTAMMMDMDLSNEGEPVPPMKSTKRSIVIFHCEFSSERGPSLLKFLRNSDRTLNEHCYPNLFYPELYLLEGGYKSFYENYKAYCEPQSYKPMLHTEHSNDYKHFRGKAKSWDVSKHLIVFKYNEHLQKQKSLQTQNELNEDEEKQRQQPHQQRRIIKMKTNF